MYHTYTKYSFNRNITVQNIQSVWICQYKVFSRRIFRHEKSSRWIFHSIQSVGTLQCKYSVGIDMPVQNIQPVDIPIRNIQSVDILVRKIHSLGTFQYEYSVGRDMPVQNIQSVWICQYEIFTWWIFQNEKFTRSGHSRTNI